MTARILPSRFYSRDPAELADELIAARQGDAEYQARRLFERLAVATPVIEADRSHRYRGTVAKRLRIQALVAEVLKKEKR